MNRSDRNRPPARASRQRRGRPAPRKDDGDLQVPDWRNKLHELIFEADTPIGKAFDIFLMIAILVSITAISLETVEDFEPYRPVLVVIEWVITILFTIEYILRIICVRRPMRYIFSFYGIVDFVSILPTYLAVFSGLSSTSSFAMVRALRLLRVFRIFKLVHMLREADTLWRAVWQARGKVVVFFGTVLITVCIVSTLMYVIEHDHNPGFTSIPQSMYWAIVTMTTVGYGDVVPQTAAGKFISAILILLGYSLIIVPTGFVSAEFVSRARREVTTQVCASCMKEGHDPDAAHCKFCGDKLS